MSGRDRRTIVANLETVRSQIVRACERSGRDPSSVRLVAAAKSVEPAAIEVVRDAGVRDVGENYVQDLRSKREQVPGVTWHFIGRLQSRSAPRVADLADVVQSAVPGRAARRLGRRAAATGRTLPALLEIDFTRERAGVPPESAVGAADEVAAVEGLDLVGLMTVPPPPDEAPDPRPFFRRLRELLEEVATRHPGAVELSMGMSLDYEVAVEEGATMVRIGTALFGARPAAEQGRT